MSESLSELEYAINEVLGDDESTSWVAQSNPARETKKAHTEWVCAIVIFSIFLAAFVGISIYKQHLNTGGAIVIGLLFTILCVLVSGRDWYKKFRCRLATSVVYVITTKRAFICMKDCVRGSTAINLRVQRSFSPDKRVNLTVLSGSDGGGDIIFETPNDLDHKGRSKRPNIFSSVDQIAKAEKLLRKLFPNAGVCVIKKEKKSGATA